MAVHEGPQITAIAGVIAKNLPHDGVSEEEATQAWRGALRYARATGTIQSVTQGIKQDLPGSRMVEALCDELEK